MNNPSEQKRHAMLESRIKAHAAAMNELAGMSGQLTTIAAMVEDCLANGGKILVCGNGGSAAEAQHFATEFVGRYGPRTGRPLHFAGFHGHRCRSGSPSRHHSFFVRSSRASALSSGLRV